MRIKLKCKYCPRMFYMEYNLNCHLLFGHEFLMPVCSTGISEKLYHDNMYLILSFRKIKKELSHYKTELKMRFLKYNYGKNRNMKDVYQDNYFNKNLELHHSHLHTNIAYMNHNKYDLAFVEATTILKRIEAKGLIYA